MHDNDGEREERELVLGTKQLLGIFFVGTLLCGVFFAMGYVVGGNSAKAGVPTAATDSVPAVTSDNGKREEPKGPSTTESAAAAPLSGETGGTLPAAEPRLADNPAAAGAQPPAPVTAAATIPSASPAAVKSAAPTPVSAAGNVYISVPEKGTSYWQVTATGRPAADTLVKALRERQLPAILAESPTEGRYRVLVGPYRSQPALASAKRTLMTVGGFGDLFVQKY